MRKKLFIDGQVFQSAAWDRGMGKYSLALLKALQAHKHYEYSEACIIFTSNMPLKPEVKKALKDAAPAMKQLVLDLEVPEDPCTADIPKMQQKNRNVLQAEIDSRTDGDAYDFLIPSLFIDQVCIVFPEAADKKILVFYDLIPLQYVERYSQLCAFPNYLKRFTEIFAADIIWSISQTVADDVVLNLGIDPRRVFNVDGGPIDRSDDHPKRPDKNIPERFILMPSGNDLRKNNIRAVQGFEEYLARSGEDTKLVITSFFDEHTRQQLLAYSQNIIFTGNVEEAELHWLYKASEALLFVPEYEGLGLPILEAALVNKPVICSNIGVFNEISTQAFYYCDHLNPTSIGDAIQEALSDTDRKDKIQLYPEILKRYSWTNTAESALNSLVYNPPVVPKKLRLAVLTPSPASYSTIGKHVLQMHPTLAEYFHVDYFVETGKTTHELPRTDYLPVIANVHPAEQFAKDTYRHYDAVLYHIGNSEFHLETIKSALHLPGYGIVHDTKLAGIFNGELSTYQYISKERYRQEALLDEQLANKQTAFLTSLANRQIGLVTHSNYATDAIKHTLLKSVPIQRSNLAVATPKDIGLRLPGKQLTIGFAGIIHPAKGLDILERVAQDRELLDFQIHVFGLSLVSDDVIRRLESYANVTVDTNVSDFTFQMMLRDVDVLINYRTEYNGEASAATLEAMRFGVVPIVRKVGWYDELPDDAAIKVSEPDGVIAALKDYLTWGDDDRLVWAERAHDYVVENHTYGQYVRELYEFMSEQGAGATDAPNQRLRQGIKKGLSKQALLRRNITQ